MFNYVLCVTIVLFVQGVMHGETPLRVARADQAAVKEKFASGAIGVGDIAAFQQDFTLRREYILAQNAVTEVDVTEIALNRSLVMSIDHTFSHTLDNWQATNQMKSGRCWMFAGLNVMRVDTM